MPVPNNVSTFKGSMNREKEKRNNRKYKNKIFYTTAWKFVGF